MRNFRVLHGILVHVSTKPSASTPPPSGKVPRAVGTAQGRASLMLHALIYLIFGIITVFVQTPDNVFTKILLGLWMLALGTSHALTARGMHYGPATSTSLSSTALVQAASGALLVIMPDTLALIILAVCAGSGLPGLIKLLLGMRYRSAVAVWRDWVLEGGVLLAVALLLPFVGEIGAKATLGVPGGGALIIGIFLLVGSLGPNEKAGADRTKL